MAYFGNSLPKNLISLGQMREPAFAQSLRRFIAAILVTGGLLFSAGWLLAPMAFALPLSLVSVGGALALVFLAIVGCAISQAKR